MEGLAFQFDSKIPERKREAIREVLFLVGVPDSKGSARGRKSFGICSDAAGIPLFM